LKIIDNIENDDKYPVVDGFVDKIYSTLEAY